MGAGGRGSLTGRGRTILDASIAESKRLGRSTTDMVALAVVISARPDSVEEFDETFGEGACLAMRGLARNLSVVGDEAQVIETLTESENTGASWVSSLDKSYPDLRQLLADRPKQAETAAPDPAQSNEAAEDPEIEMNKGPAPASEVKQKAEVNAAELADALKGRVRGQDEVIDSIVRRLAVTRADFDIRSHRPDGVFMFVGPTGVGKTELAAAISAELMGDKDSLIRLDMSEYSHDWAISRLTGPMPGYVGSNEPNSWLTTKVINNPNSVVLLDEIEKAHPAVWNVFLQAFDAGRLTDSRGKVADFSNTVIVMTSNMGAEVFTKPTIGFVRDEEDGAKRDERESRDLAGSVSAALPPELVNRLDHVATFRALSEDDIKEIAHLELSR